MYKHPFAIYPVHFGSPKQPVFLRFILESIRELLGPISLFQRKGFAQIFPFSKIRATPYANLITDYTWFQAHLPGNMVQSQIIGISGFTGISIRRCGTSQIIETILTQASRYMDLVSTRLSDRLPGYAASQLSGFLSYPGLSQKTIRLSGV